MIYSSTAFNFLQASYLVFQAKTCHLIRFALSFPFPCVLETGYVTLSVIEENSRTVNELASGCMVILFGAIQRLGRVPHNLRMNTTSASP
jgi:hypothetical protein